MTNVLVTGASGFVGQILCAALARAGYRVLAAMRNTATPPAGTRSVLIKAIDGSTDWQRALEGVDVVVHLAARAHLVSGDASARQIEPYLAVNAQGTQQLAQACVKSGVRTFLYLSSIKVNGEETLERPFTPKDVPAPRDHYAESKWLGEQAVQSLGNGKFQWMIVRSPLIYGPGVRANFLRLMRWVDRGWPLPFGSLRNRRSLIYVENLCDLIVTAIRTGGGAGQILMAADNEDLSTPELCRRIAKAMGRRAHLWPIPLRVLKGVGRLAGLSAEMSRLTGSLAVDARQTRVCLGWAPPFSIEQGIAETVSWYLKSSRRSSAE